MRTSWGAIGSERVRLALLTLLVVGVSAGCLPEPQKLQSGALLDQLATARLMFSEQPPPNDTACALVGDVQTRLFGEPGLVDIRPAWPALRDAAQALQAACGQSILLGQPTPNGSYALTQAHQRWQQGILREIDVACDHLRDAAVALNRQAPC